MLVSRVTRHCGHLVPFWGLKQFNSAKLWQLRWPRSSRAFICLCASVHCQVVASGAAFPLYSAFLLPRPTYFYSPQLAQRCHRACIRHAYLHNEIASVEATQSSKRGSTPASAQTEANSFRSRHCSRRRARSQAPFHTRRSQTA